jgi:hypothetical protein
MNAEEITIRLVTLVTPAEYTDASELAEIIRDAQRAVSAAVRAEVPPALVLAAVERQMNGKWYGIVPVIRFKQIVAAFVELGDEETHKRAA